MTVNGLDLKFIKKPDFEINFNALSADDGKLKYLRVKIGNESFHLTRKQASSLYEALGMALMNGPL